MTEAEKRKYYMSAEYREEMENFLASQYWFMKTDSGRCFTMEWNNGWLEAFAELCRQLLVEVSDDFGFLQLKEKYGTARVYYYGHITPYGEELINDFENNITANICMFCGAEGSLRNTNQWITCMCDTCYQKFVNNNLEEEEE